jgi:RimJ/RimL family protein N-acetyltransferase
MPSIETDRLLLRHFRLDDLDDLARLFSDPEVMRYVGNGQPINRDESDRALRSIIKHWQGHGFGRWAVLDKVSKQFLGFGGLRSLFDTPEIVYHFAKASWGKGLATELARASLRFGFEDRKFRRIVAVAKPENHASVHVMEKLGMHFEMYTTYYNIDVIQYEINRDEFKMDDSLYILRSNEL